MTQLQPTDNKKGGSYRELAGKVLLPLIGLVVTDTLLGLGMTAVLTRALSPKAWGEYNLLITVATVTVILIPTWADVAATRFIVERRVRGEDAFEIHSAMLLLRFGFFLLAFSVAIVTASMFCTLYKVPKLSHLIWIAALPPLALIPLTNHFLAVTQGYERINRWALLRLATAVVAFVSIALPAFLGVVRDPGGVVQFGALGWLIALILCAAGASPVLGHSRLALPHASTIVALFRFGLSIQVGVLVATPISFLVRYLLSHYQGAIPVGHYAIALTVQGYPVLLYTAIMVPVFPEWSRLYAEQNGAALLKSYRQIRNILVAVSLIYMGVFLLGRERLIVLLFGQDSAAATPTILAILAACPVALLGCIGSGCCVVGKRTSTIGLANFIWAIGILPLLIWLVPRYGSVGAAIAWVGSYVIYSAVYAPRLRPFFQELRAWARKTHPLPVNEAEVPSRL